MNIYSDKQFGEKIFCVCLVRVCTRQNPCFKIERVELLHFWKMVGIMNTVGHPWEIDATRMEDKIIFLINIRSILEFTMILDSPRFSKQCLIIKFKK